MTKLTPVLIADTIETCLPFWTDRLGFRKTSEGPGYVILNKGGVEIMYQTPEFADLESAGPAVFSIEVENIEEIEAKMEGLEPVIPLRQMSYGAAEIGYREPAGNVVIFAMQAGY
ncbi:MAG TPA: VOC family protein [Bryobacteraceae bacterium]|nr:VOC family protein [Bryobacteraceae bacterium]